jgi:hypothetical protein
MASSSLQSIRRAQGFPRIIDSKRDPNPAAFAATDPMSVKLSQSIDPPSETANSPNCCSARAGRFCNWAVAELRADADVISHQTIPPPIIALKIVNGNADVMRSMKAVRDYHALLPRLKIDKATLSQIQQATRSRRASDESVGLIIGRPDFSGASPVITFFKFTLIASHDQPPPWS